jgi:hypothetical protein
MSLLQKAESFLYFDDTITDRIHAWATSRSGTFPSRDSKSYEHPLEHMQLFHEYSALFEDVIAAFLEANAISSGDFYGEIRREHEDAVAQRRNIASTFASVLLAATDFDSFCELMNDVKEGRGVVFCPPLVDDADSVPERAGDSNGGNGAGATGEEVD